MCIYAPRITSSLNRSSAPGRSSGSIRMQTLPTLPQVLSLLHVRRLLRVPGGVLLLRQPTDDAARGDVARRPSGERWLYLI